jgi:hypothetical protein
MTRPRIIRVDPEKPYNCPFCVTKRGYSPKCKWGEWITYDCSPVTCSRIEIHVKFKKRKVAK